MRAHFRKHAINFPNLQSFERKRPHFLHLNENNVNYSNKLRNLRHTGSSRLSSTAASTLAVCTDTVESEWSFTVNCEKGTRETAVNRLLCGWENCEVGKFRWYQVLLKSCSILFSLVTGTGYVFIFFIFNYRFI